MIAGTIHPTRDTPDGRLAMSLIEDYRLATPGQGFVGCFT